MVKAPQGYDTGKIGSINDIMNTFYKNDIDMDECLVQLHEVATSPPTCGIWSTLFFFVVSSALASVVVFGGGWMDSAISSITGLMVAILFILSTHFPIYARVFEVSASVCVAMVARALHNYCCFTSVAMASILILLPGYTMTMGVVRKIVYR
jgi:uncharacterized membrane protein YjjP (DUF1212 family)